MESSCELSESCSTKMWALAKRRIQQAKVHLQGRLWHDEERLALVCKQFYAHSCTTAVENDCKNKNREQLAGERNEGNRAYQGRVEKLMEAQSIFEHYR